MLNAQRFKRSSLVCNLVILTLLVLLGGSAVTAMAAPPANVPDRPETAGSISGRVTDNSEEVETPVAGARVEAFSCADETPAGTAMTNDNGEYVLAPISNGCYRLRFAKDGYESSWYGEPPLKDSAIEVIVAGEKVTEIDVPISVAGSLITGRVKGEDGKPLAGAWVTAFQLEGMEGSISDARTDEKGIFSIGVYPGSYFLIFARSGYVTRLHGKSLEDPTAVEATAGGKTGGIEAVLSKGGRITGTLTDAGGKALHGIYVLANAVDRAMLPVTARTDEGRFVLDGLPSGKYRIAFFDSEQSYSPQWYDGKTDPEEALQVGVTAPGTTSGIKGVLRPAGGISGRVTAASGNALPQVTVLARAIDGKRVVGNALTDELGEYTISGLPSGSYIVAFRPEASALRPYFYRNATDAQAAIPVEVTAPQLTFGIDQILPDGIFLTGSVKDSDGEPLPVSFIAVYPVGSDSMAGFKMAEPDGTFSISLPEGEYVVECSREGYLSQWSGGHSERSKAEPVVIAKDQAIKPLDIILSRGGSLSGSVKNRAGVGITGVTVSATNAGTGEQGGSTTTEEGGTFLIVGLPSGLFHLTAVGSEMGYVRERLLQPVQVRAPDATENIEIIMKNGGAVAGRVVDRAGNPLQRVTVSAHDPLTWNEIASTETDANGSYQLGGLPENRYRLRFEKSGFRVQWFKGKTRREESMPVEVVGTSTIPAIDAILDSGIPLSGVVTDAAGAPLYRADIEIYGDVEDEPFDRVRTDEQGKFTVPTLAPGSYRVRFGHSDHIPQWYGGRDRRTAAPVVVTETRIPIVSAALVKSGGMVSGKLTSPTGDDIGQAWLTVLDAATGIAIADERICECSGKFDTPVPTGRYQLRVERHGQVSWYGGDSRKSAMVLPVSGTVSDLNMIIKDH